MRKSSGPSGGAAFASELTTEIHEVLGHGSGRMADHVTVTAAGSAEGAVFGARGDARRPGRAVFRGRSVSGRRSACVPPDEQQAVVQTEYEAYARNALVQLRRVRVGAQLEEDHMRNRQAIVHWLLAQHHARSRSGAATARPFTWSSTPTRSATAWRGCWPKCSASSRKAITRRPRQLFETYGVHFDPELRDEVVARVDHLNLPSYTGFVMPKLEPVHDADGQHHRRQDLVSLRPDHANARVL